MSSKVLDLYESLESIFRGCYPLFSYRAKGILKMNFEDVAEAISPDVYKQFKQALELGKWPDGRKLSAAQKEICLQAIMLYEAKHQVADTERVGYVDSPKKKEPRGIDKVQDDVSTIKILH
ncbi:MAG: hypothetical protein ACI84K_000532 [Pseudohongiellaceae bacterium]